jgi:hypothetical protein
LPRLELYWREYPEYAVTPPPAVEDLEVFEDRVGELDPRTPYRRSSSSTCIGDQKASIIASW